MKKYALNGLSTSGTATKTAVAVVSSSSIRAFISEFSIGIRTAPNATDQQVNARLSHWTTAAGTSTSQTPKPLDTVDPVAAVSTAGITHTVEPTYDSTDWWNGDLNQRGLFRFVAEIGFEPASGAAGTTGTGVQMVACTSALQLSAPLHFKE